MPFTRYAKDVERCDEIAREVMDLHGVGIVDLYGSTELLWHSSACFYSKNRTRIRIVIE